MPSNTSAAASKIQRATNCLKGLAEAPTLACFKLQADVVVDLVSVLSLDNHDILQRCLAAIAHGYSLLLTAGQQELLGQGISKDNSQGLVILELMHKLFTERCHAEGPNITTQSSRVQQRPIDMAVLAARSGMLEQLPDVCLMLATLLSSANQRRQDVGIGQPQQQALNKWALNTQVECFTDLGNTVLELLGLWALQSPGYRLLLSPALVPVWPAAAALAVTLLRCNTATPNPQPESSCHDVFLEATTSQLDAQGGSSVFAAVTLQTCSMWVRKHGRLADAVSSFPAVMALGGPVWELVMVHLAFLASAWHKEQQGLPQAPTAGASAPFAKHGRFQSLLQQQVPPYHAQLLSALGVAGAVCVVPRQDTVVQASGHIALLRAAMEAAAANSLHTTTSTSDAAISKSYNYSINSCNTGGDAAGWYSAHYSAQVADAPDGGSSRQQHQHQHQQVTCHAGSAATVPVLLVTVECMLLYQDHGFMSQALLACLAILNHHLSQPASPDSRTAQQQLVSELLPVLLKRVLPAAQTADAINAGAAAAESIVLAVSRAVYDLAEDVTNGGVLQTDRNLKAFGAVFRQSAKQMCKLLEVLLRSGGDLAASAQQLHGMCCVVVRAAVTASDIDSVTPAQTTAEDSGGSAWFAPESVQRSLFSLLLSCFKIIAALPPDTVSSSSHGVGFWPLVDTPQSKMLSSCWGLLGMFIGQTSVLMAGPSQVGFALPASGDSPQCMPSQHSANMADKCGGSSSNCKSVAPAVADDSVSDDNPRIVAQADYICSGQLWCILAARYLVAAGKQLQVQAVELKQQQQDGPQLANSSSYRSTCSISSSSCCDDDSNGGSVGGSNSMSAAFNSVSSVLFACKSTVTWLREQFEATSSAEPGSRPPLDDVAAGPGLALPELLAQAAQLLQQLEDIKVHTPASEPIANIVQRATTAIQEPALHSPLSNVEASAAGEVAAAPAMTTLLAAMTGLGQQLEAFGAAVCAQLPVPYCCNYHRCSNAIKHTERQLVSGKSSVCSSCKTARYCSSACQKAHWHGWHKPVCKRLKQQRQQHQQPV